MKKILYLSILLTILTSCNSGNNSNNTNSGTNQTQAAAEIIQNTETTPNDKGLQSGQTLSTTEGNWIPLGSPGFSEGVATSTGIAFNPENNQPYVAFVDNANGNRATVMTFDGSKWVNVGDSGFSKEINVTGGNDINIAFNPENKQPYVVFQENSGRQRISVFTYDGKNWKAVGNSSFSAGAAIHPSIAFNPQNNQPYVAFEDRSQNGSATVMTFDGKKWINVGEAGFTEGQAQDLDVEFNSKDSIPYVAFMDGSQSNKITVMSFDGKSWNTVGNPGISKSVSYFPKLAFSTKDNIPYVAFSDEKDEYKTSLMYYTGSEKNGWEYVGNEGFSAGSASYVSLAFNPSNNQPYVAFMDSSVLNKTTVMTFDGSEKGWQNVGTEGFSTNCVNFTRIAFDLTNFIPYVVYEDCTMVGRSTVMTFNAK